MNRCCAYNRAATNRDLWVPCARRNLRGTPFCRRHDDAFRGVILGVAAELR